MSNSSSRIRIGNYKISQNPTIIPELIQNLQKEKSSIITKVNLKIKERMEINKQIDELEERGRQITETLPKLQAMKG